VGKASSRCVQSSGLKPESWYILQCLNVETYLGKGRSCLWAFVPCSLLSQPQSRQQIETAEPGSPRQGGPSEAGGASSFSCTGLAKESMGESSQSCGRTGDLRGVEKRRRE